VTHNLSDLVANGLAYQVVGVARDSRAAEFRATDSKRVYLPMPLERTHLYSILVRTGTAPAQVIGGLDPVLSSIDPNMMASCATLDEMLSRSAPAFTASLAALVASTIGLFGLMLAPMGIYGTVSYIAVLRTREVGIRMAIGAQKRNVLGLILAKAPGRFVQD
jgi:macrolide transport system ATP-binding/permease protein